MNTDAVILMVTTQVLVTAITGYLFWKILKTPPNNEPDSFSENDKLKR
jgi:hypothetical protein